MFPRSLPWGDLSRIKKMQASHAKQSSIGRSRASLRVLEHLPMEQSLL
jgi:hypothetical protein